jgi:hypothetical protein
LEEQRKAPTTHQLAFEERLALLFDRERLYRQNGRYCGLLREARGDGSYRKILKRLAGVGGTGRRHNPRCS